MSIVLGQQVKDSITGYKGTAVGKIYWLYGCRRIGIQGPLDKDGKVPEVVWFDEDQIIALPIKSKAKKKVAGTPPAGPRDNGCRRKEPKR